MWAATLSAVALAAVWLVGLPGGVPQRSSGKGPEPGPATTTAQVTVLPGADRLAIAANFLGFSTEYSALPVDERHIALYSRVIELLHVPGGGPFLLRIGGASSDHAFWDPTLRDMPPWAIRLSPEWIAQAASIVRANHLQVIIDLNLITATPAIDADWAQAAEQAFPAHSILGFEVGNEPDLYAREAWMVRLGGADFDLGVLPRAITPASYARAYRAYARALGQVAPGVPLFGPAVAEPRRHRSWISTLIAGPHPGLAAITVHKYAYSACARVGTAGHPTVEKLLSARSSERMASAIAPAARLAHAAGLPLRLTEFNSVTCGGVNGVSNTFATALWAPRALFALARAGAASADLHVRVFLPNSPFRYHGDSIFARPLLYGLALFDRTLGPDSHLVAARVRAPAGSELTAWAVTQGRRSVRVLLLNDGARTLAVNLRLRRERGAGTATVERLLAPSAWSRGNVTLAGQRLDGQARWVGRLQVAAIAPRHGHYLVTVRRESGALVSIPLARRRAGSRRSGAQRPGR